MTEVNPKVLFAQDLMKVQKEMQAVIKGSKNPFFKSDYADLNAHLNVVRPVLMKNGFVLDQSTTVINGINLAITRITHVATAETKESVLALPETPDMQKLGGAITYARRYTLSALFAMQAIDDDGNTAAGKTSKAKRSAF